MFRDIYAISYKMKRELYHKIFTIAFAVILCFVAISLFMTFVLFPVRDKSVSMTPDVATNGFELVTPLLRTPKRGDVMLVQVYPVEKKSLPVRFVNLLGRFLTAQQWQPVAEDRNETSQFVRRVIGMPGDTIYLDNYIAYIQPKDEKHFKTEFELTETKYNVTTVTPPSRWDTELGVQGKTVAVTLGENEYFVLGDNRLASADSRLWGAVTQGAFRGKLLLQYMPFSKFRLF